MTKPSHSGLIYHPSLLPQTPSIVTFSNSKLPSVSFPTSWLFSLLLLPLGMLPFCSFPMSFPSYTHLAHPCSHFRNQIQPLHSSQLSLVPSSGLAGSWHLGSSLLGIPTPLLLPKSLYLFFHWIHSFLCPGLRTSTMGICCMNCVMIHINDRS